MNSNLNETCPPRPTLVANDVDDAEDTDNAIEDFLSMFDGEDVVIPESKAESAPASESFKTSPLPSLDSVEDPGQFATVPDDLSLFEQLDAMFSSEAPAAAPAGDDVPMMLKKTVPVVAKVTITVKGDMERIDAKRRRLGIAPEIF